MKKNNASSKKRIPNWYEQSACTCITNTIAVLTLSVVTKTQIMNVLKFKVVFSWCIQAWEWRVMHTKCSWPPSQLATANAAADFTVGGGVAGLAGSWQTQRLMGSFAWLCEVSQWLKVLHWTDSMSWTGVEAFAYHNKEFSPSMPPVRPSSSSVRATVAFLRLHVSPHLMLPVLQQTTIQKDTGCSSPIE